MEFNLDLVQSQNPIIGREFLTWLWYQTEAGSNVFELKNGSSFSLNLAEKIIVQGGEGDNTETAICSGLMTEMREARTGLKIGKKVQQAKIHIQKDAFEWSVTLDSTQLNFSAMKTPKIERNNDDDPDALILEKIYLLEQGIECIDTVFSLFLKKRLENEWEKEKQAMRKWIIQDETDIF